MAETVDSFLFFPSVFSFSYLKLIAHPPDCLDILALIAHFTSQFFDMSINGSGISEIIIIPHRIQDLSLERAIPSFSRK